MKEIFVVLAIAFAFITAMPITTVMAKMAACTGPLTNLSTADIWRALGVD